MMRKSDRRDREDRPRRDRDDRPRRDDMFGGDE